MHGSPEASPVGHSSALWMSTIAFTVCFAVWTILSIIGVRIQKKLGLVKPLWPADRHARSSPAPLCASFSASGRTSMAGALFFFATKDDPVLRQRRAKGLKPKSIWLEMEPLKNVQV